jgi:polysaccharide biosynthesis protein PslH
LFNYAFAGDESLLTQSATSIRQETVSTQPSGAPLRVLHFVPRVPWPLNTGAKLRNYHLAREIAQRASITLLAFSENGERLDKGGEAATRPDTGGAHADESSAEPLLASPEHFYKRVILVGRDEGYTLAKIVRGAIGRTPLPVLNYTTPAMKQELARVLDEQDFDVVQVESIHLAEYLPIIGAARNRPQIICDWHNIESELMQRYSERETNLLRRAYARRASGQMSSLERRAMREFDAHVVVSSRDGERLRELEPMARIFLIENGVDTAYYADERIKRAHARWLKEQGVAGGESPHDARQGAQEKLRRIAFVGSMDYHANVDAVVSFATEVWPRLREQQSHLIFTIVGRDPAPEVRQLTEIPGIEVTGTVEDVRPYYEETLCAIIPLRVGGGSRLKILEAMAAGVPVVSTTLGAEGLDVRDGENILIAETGDDFCDAINSLDEERRRALTAGGRALVYGQYDWSRLGALLFETYRSLLNKGEAVDVKAP